MDETLAGAILAVPLDSSNARTWFETIVAVYDGLRESQMEGDWSAFESRFSQAASEAGFNSDLTTAFLQRLDQNDRMDTVRQLSEIGASALPAQYDELLAQFYAAQAQNEQAAPTAQTEDPWQTVLIQCGPGWQGWNGTEDHWQTLLNWTYTTTNAINPTVYAAAYQKFQEGAALPIPQRVQTLRSWGIQVADAPAPAAPAEDPWQTALTQCGPGWQGWNGTEDHWQTLLNWTYTTTNAINPTVYAAAYQNFGSVAALPLAERAETLRSWGIQVAALPDIAPSAAAEGAAQELSPVEEQFVEQLSDQLAPQVQAAIEAEPDLFDGLSEADIREAIATAVANQISA